LLDKLWIKMAEMYGHRWTSSFGLVADSDHTWAKVLKDVTGAQIANGLNALTDRASEFDWPPPANVFRALCLQVKGLPSETDAWFEAVQGRYSHVAVRVAAEATSTFDLKTAQPDDKTLRQRFERNYAIVMRRAQNGQPLNGRIADGICHDSSRSPQQKQLEYSHQEAMRVVATLGIPIDPKSARAQLLASLGIRRDKHV
jgi:hypothetical protein